MLRNTFPQCFLSWHLLPSASSQGVGMQQCSGCGMCRHVRALVTAAAAGAGTRLILMLPSACASGKIDKLDHLQWHFAGHRLPLLRNLAKPPKSKCLRCIYFTVDFSQGCSLPEQLIISQALRFLTFKHRKHVFKQMFAMKPRGSQLLYSPVSNIWQELFPSKALSWAELAHGWLEEWSRGCK